ncbi:Uncharacterised protein [Citrobacter koseri]|uniref:Uncharacterized protein n=1 Tax=Citrobacter koseri TaxID=545 RepID=A0A2X2YG83_CITKO|nr:Uncharacterised protein [Citrobacter koseri]
MLPGGGKRMQHDRRSVARAGPPTGQHYYAAEQQHYGLHNAPRFHCLPPEIAQGESWLCCAVSASGQQKKYTAIPQLQINDNQVVIREPESARQLSFFL